MSADSPYLALNHAEQEERQEQADDGPADDEAHFGSDDERLHIARARPEREADAHLPSSLRNRVGGDAVEARADEEDAERCKDGEDLQPEARLGIFVRLKRVLQRAQMPHDGAAV